MFFVLIDLPFTEYNASKIMQYIVCLCPFGEFIISDIMFFSFKSFQLETFCFGYFLFPFLLCHASFKNLHIYVSYFN
jgi:hypothetical protein